jgi:hypothetical protein
MHLFLTTSLGLTFLFGSRRVKNEKKGASKKTFLLGVYDNKEKKRKKRQR